MCRIKAFWVPILHTSLMLNMSDMDAAKCELSYPSLLPPSTNASQSCVHIVGHLMHLIHFTNKAAMMLPDYRFSLEECVYKAYLQTISTDHACTRVLQQSARAQWTEWEYTFPEVTKWCQLQKAIGPWERT